MTLELAVPSDLVAYQAGDPDQALLAAEAAVRAYCGWHISPPRTDTVTTSGAAWTGFLFLPTLHLTAVVSVTEDGTAIDPGDYLVHHSGYLTRTTPAEGFSTWDTAVETIVQFTHGYDLAPADLQGVVISLASRSTNAPGNLVRVGQVQYGTGTDAFTDAERSILRTYRLPSAP